MANLSKPIGVRGGTGFLGSDGTILTMLLSEQTQTVLVSLALPLKRHREQQCLNRAPLLTTETPYWKHYHRRLCPVLKRVQAGAQALFSHVFGNAKFFGL